VPAFYTILQYYYIPTNIKFSGIVELFNDSLQMISIVVDKVHFAAEVDSFWTGVC